MKKPAVLIFWAAAMFVGRQLAGAVHEFAHAFVTVVLGGRVDWIQPFPILGQAETKIAGLSGFSAAVVDISGVLVTTLVAAAAVLLVPWRKLQAVVASTVIVLVVCFLMGLGAFAGYALSTGFNDAANFIRHSGANRIVVFLVSGTAFMWMMWILVNRTQMASTFMRAFYGEGEHGNRSLGYARGTALVLFFLLGDFLFAGKPHPYNRVPVGLAVLLDGVAIKNTSATAEIRDGQVRLLHGGKWFEVGFGQLGPGGVVALPYGSFTNTAGTRLPAEVYSPAEIRVSATGYDTHYYAADENGRNPRVVAGWTNRLADVKQPP